MTSPQTTSTEVIARMAATGLDDNGLHNLNLTAEQTPEPEMNARTAHEREERAETFPPEEKKQEDTVREAAEEKQGQRDLMRPEGDAIPTPNHDGQPHQLEVNSTAQQPEEEKKQSDPIRPEDAAIPQLSHGDLQAGFEFPSQAQIAGLDALMAMGQIGQLGQLGYDQNLPFPQAGELAMPMMSVPNPDDPFVSPDDYVPDTNRPEDRLVGYAKLVFEDGEFYMNTHSIILGRDPGAHRAALRREKEEAKRKIEAESPRPNPPVQIKREHIAYSRSVFSEKSGILREDNDSDDETRRRRQRRKASKKSKSTGSSYELSRRNSVAQLPPKTHIYEAQYPGRVKEENAVPVDPAALRPNPNECPIIPLHPPGNAPASAYKSISREHVKIAYNFNKATFELHIYGRNGAFVDEVYHPQNSVVELKSGNMLQIGQVPLEFVLPDGIVGDGQAYDGELDEDGHLVGPNGGKEMSFDFEEDKRNGAPEDTSPELMSDDRDGGDDDDDEGEEDMNEDGEELDAEGEDDGEIEMSDQEKSVVLEGDEEEVGDDQEPQSAAPSGKKRGPGRPPKNGVMSAREEREQKAAMKVALGNQKVQKAQKSLPQSGSALPPEKKKVGRPRKHDKPDPTEPEKPKRKYTKRKPKEPKDGETKQDGSDGDDQAKEKKEKKTKPPRSPSPHFDESTLTPEELQKPQANYVTLIYEALSNSADGKLGLSQIYRAIQRKYPYFVLKVGTLGWQSSVRHNLSQHHAFYKVERDGKGWMWGIVDGVSIEKEKKRRTPPPPQIGGPMHHQQIYQAGQQRPHYMGPGQHPYPHQSLIGQPGFMPHQINTGATHPGQSQQFMGPLQPHMNGRPQPPNYQPPANPTSLIPQMAAPAAYSSPYAPKPTAPAAHPAGEQRPANEQQPTAQLPPPPGPPQGPPPSQPAQSQSGPGQQPQSQPQSQTQGQPYQGPRNPSPPQQPGPASSKLPQHIPQVISATDLFKKTMLEPMKKHPHGEEILNSAIDQVLGYTHQSAHPGNPYEEGIMKALRSMLERIPGSNLAPSNPGPAAVPQTNGQQQPQSSQANQSEPQANATSTTQPTKSSGQDKPTPTVMRPTFTGQGQSRPNISRPPIGTPGMRRTNSGSPAQQAVDTLQVAGQKRPLEDADDYKDVKRINGSGMSPLKT